MRAIIKGAFSITGRGTAISIELREGKVKRGDRIQCPMRSGQAQELVVDGVESMDSIGEKRSSTALVIGMVNPQDILIGGEIAGKS